MNSKHSNKELWQLLASFILPITAAVVLLWVFNSSDIDKDNKIRDFFGTMNYGTLIEPAVETTKNDIVFSKKTPGTTDRIWTLAYVTNQCDSACTQTLKDMKTIRILMNEDMRRIQRLLLINGTTDLQEYGVFIANPSEALSQKLGKFPDNTLFLIDPKGNVMIHYDPQTLEIKRVIKDLKRLFRYSRIG
ncbi:MAG: hypothetical protein ABGX28_05080 [Methylococcales bacterium]|jgi:cytochrome oxidase Cu insertion factor (SCO1/SenC/PrrC family)